MLPAWASEYVGIPFADYGRTREGADCWGLARLIWRERAGIVLPEFAIDPNDGAACQAAMHSNIGCWVGVAPGDEAPLDGVMMTGCYGSGRQTRRAEMHVGVVIVPGWLIHTDAETTYSTLARYRDSLQRHDVVGFWRHTSLA